MANHKKKGNLDMWRMNMLDEKSLTEESRGNIVDNIKRRPISGRSHIAGWDCDQHVERDPSDRNKKGGN